MDLVTVTCKKDLQFFELQVKSTVKFLQPCTHWVIINEDDPAEALEKISKVYQNSQHQLKILTQKDFMPLQGSGWQKQQAYKLLVSKYINDDYLLLDSKNFFIRNCSTDHWKNTVGCGFLERVVDGPWEEASNYYARQLNKDVLHRCLSVQTPFKIQKSILDKLDNIDSAIKRFNLKPLDTLHSEFLFYSYLLDRPLPQTGCLHKTLWKISHINGDLLDALKYEFERGWLCLGIHRDFLSSLHEMDLNKINEFLDYLDLNFKFESCNINL